MGRSSVASGKHMENDCFPRTLKFEMNAMKHEAYVYPKPALQSLNTYAFIVESILALPNNKFGIISQLKI
jgi:hypothetical protein